MDQIIVFAGLKNEAEPITLGLNHQGLFRPPFQFIFHICVAIVFNPSLALHLVWSHGAVMNTFPNKKLLQTGVLGRASQQFG